ncbi:ATP-binding protein [Catellatospora sp. TT07R-123]|uniref:ATP-binding protein n=1 Tax=Catellatospora sp. TT07R-123 TaxID=2733863 RepID=UPI001FD52F9D|nr:ATP-binding protein [Catellatospora sp. TT07R-123]
MRAVLARGTLAVTSMVALAFLVPLALVTKQIAADRALIDARQQAAAAVTAMTVAADRAELARAVAATVAGPQHRMAVHLPDGAPLGATHARPEDVSLVAARGGALTTEVDGGVVLLQPAALDGGRTAVVEVFVPAGDLTRGVATAWWSMGVLATLLVAASVVLADRLGARVVRAARELATASRAIGAGDLTVRVEPAGPPDLLDVGEAFNAMADRLTAVIDDERERAADLSHRLRTPLTALRLDTDALPPGPASDRMRQAVEALDAEIDAIIASARRTAAERALEETDLVDVVADRLAFWAVLAEDHGRPWQVHGADGPVWLPVPRADVIGAVDALVGNIFRHTPQGTGFRLRVTGQQLVVEDAGPGIADPEAALRRGVSGGGSTGLGLDIVCRVARQAGGTVTVDRGDLGGARITVSLAPTTPAQAPAPARFRRGMPG